MAVMCGALYDALRSVDVDEDLARKAAEEVAELRLRSIRSAKPHPAENASAGLVDSFTVVKWMTALLLATNFAILLRVYG